MPAWLEYLWVVPLLIIAGAVVAGSIEFIGDCIEWIQNRRSTQPPPSPPRVSYVAQERYSQQLLDCVKYLLTVDDPLGEAEYFQGLHQYTSEPPTTLAIIRRNAYAVLDNYETHEFGPNLPEDLLFLRIEAKIRENELRELSRPYEEALPIWAVGVGLITLLAAMATFGEGVLSASMLVGGFLVVVYIVSWVVAFPKRRRAKEALQAIIAAKRSMEREFNHS